MILMSHDTILERIRFPLSCAQRTNPSGRWGVCVGAIWILRIHCNAFPLSLSYATHSHKRSNVWDDRFAWEGQVLSHPPHLFRLEPREWFSTFDSNELIAPLLCLHFLSLDPAVLGFIFLGFLIDRSPIVHKTKHGPVLLWSPLLVMWTLN